LAPQATRSASVELLLNRHRRSKQRRIGQVEIVGFVASKTVISVPQAPFVWVAWFRWLTTHNTPLEGVGAPHTIAAMREI